MTTHDITREGMAWRVPSARRPDLSYTVEQDEWGEWRCECPHFVFRCRGSRRWHDCKHIVAVREQLAQTEEVS
jgi:hypothetical protein